MKLLMRRRGPRAAVHADWTAPLPQVKMRTFLMYVNGLDASYLLFSISLDEAIGLRKEGYRAESLKHVLVTPSLCAYLVNRLDGMLRSMQDYTKRHKVKPSVAPLSPVNFQGQRGRSGARSSHVLSLVMRSRRVQFMSKITRLRKMAAQISCDFRRAAEDLISIGAAAEPASIWETMDTSHFDLNTCLRETIVLLKCLIKAIPDAELSDFQKTVATMKLQPHMPAIFGSQRQPNAC